MRQYSPKRFTPRIFQTGGFSIYVGPCSSCPSAVEPWIKQFCQLPENKWFAQIDRDWAADSFNNYGLRDMFTNFDIALDLIIDSHSDEWTVLSDQSIISVLIQSKNLYGMLHSRWICQTKGLSQMKKKFEAGLFGDCPRHNCNKQHLLPMGTSLKPKHHSVKLFCPNCYDIYVPPKSIKIDGAFFGPAFPHWFLKEYEKYDKFNEYQPFEFEMFGFKLHTPKKRFDPHETNDHEDEYPEIVLND